MSVITQKIIHSLLNKKNFHSGNRDKVVNDNLKSTYFLYDTPLIELDNINRNQIKINHNNYTTNTTIRRLNRILQTLTHRDYSVKVIKGTYYLLDREGKKISTIENNHIINYNLD